MYLRHAFFFSRFIPLLNRAEVYGWVGISACLCLEGHEVEPIPGGPLIPAMCKMRPFYLCNAARYIFSENQNKNTVMHRLTLRLLMSYIYGAPSKARNANVVYTWTYVWQR